MFVKKFVYSTAAALVLALLISGCAGRGDSDAAARVIQTYGEAELAAKPDLARLSLKVETRGRSAEAAVEENARLANAVREALFEFGLTEEDVKTGSYHLYSYRDRPDIIVKPDLFEPEPEEMIVFYQAHNEIIVSTEQLEQVGEIIDVAIGAGANLVNYINFEIKDPQELKFQALRKATEQAYQKAEAIAEGAGVSIVRLTAVKEERTGYTPYFFDRAMVEDFGAGGAPTPIDPEDVKITATVIAEYSF